MLKYVKMTVGNNRRALSFAAALGVLSLVACQNHNADSGDSVSIAKGTGKVFGGIKEEKGSPISRHIVGIVAKDKTGSDRTCTGSLISSRLVLTAKHCLPGKMKDIRVYFIRNLENRFDVGAKLTQTVSRVEIHPLVAEKSVDLALLQLSSNAPEGTLNFRLAEKTFTLDEVGQAAVTGYGSEGFDKKSFMTSGDAQLKSAVVYLKESVKPELIMVDQTKGTGVCAGDSGGPLFLEDDQGFLVLGVAWSVLNKNGDDQCRGEASFTSVVAYRDWLTSTIESMNQTESK